MWSIAAVWDSGQRNGSFLIRRRRACGPGLPVATRGDQGLEWFGMLTITGWASVEPSMIVWGVCLERNSFQLLDESMRRIFHIGKHPLLQLPNFALVEAS